MSSRVTGSIDGAQNEGFFFFRSCCSDASSLKPRVGSRARPNAKSPTLRETKKKQEYVNGQLKNKYGDAFVRGNNVLYISAVKDK